MGRLDNQLATNKKEITMTKFTYKVTDMEALEKACPDAVQTIRTLNRPAIGRLFKAAQEVGMVVPGLEAIENEEVLRDIPKHLAEDAKVAKKK